MVSFPAGFVRFLPDTVELKLNPTPGDQSMTTAPSSILKSPPDGSSPPVDAAWTNNIDRKKYKLTSALADIEVKINAPDHKGPPEDKAFPTT